MCRIVGTGRRPVSYIGSYMWEYVVLHVGMRVLHVTVGRVFSSIHLKQQTSEITLVSEKLYVNLWLRELTVGNFSKVFFHM